MEIKEALTFDDVLLVPKRSSVVSRKDVDVSGKFSKNIKLNTPLVSANMDSVTESAMCIAMAREGGLGVIHQFLPIEQQVQEVMKVKRSESLLIEKPYTITKDQTLKDIWELIEEKGVTSFPVVDNQNKLMGLVTSRDTRFERDSWKKVEELMVKISDIVTAPIGTKAEEAREIMKKNRIEKLPIVDSGGFLKGLITGTDILNKEKRPQAAKDSKGRLLVSAAVGVRKGSLERTKALIDADCDVIVVDIAHGHSDLAINTVKEIRKNFGDVEIVAGNVGTEEGARDLISAGVNGVKIGVGPGSTCITRIVTGSGVPQMTAILNVSKACKEHDIPAAADGGMRNSGDLTKALAAGASCGFSGHFFAGTEEAPGITVTREGRRYKIYRGSASFGAALTRKEREKRDDLNPFDYTPEGREAIVPYRGNVADVIKQLIGGLRSGISYCGGKNIKEMQQNAEFIKLTPTGLKESGDHDVDSI